MRQSFAANWLAALLASFCAGGAGAVTIDVTGVCYTFCSGIGLVDGDPIGGTILVDDSYYSQAGNSGTESLISYAFVFGDFALTSAELPNPDFGVAWGDAPGSAWAVFLDGFLSDDPENPAAALTLAAYSDFDGNGSATNDGYSREIPGCCTESGLGNAGYFTLNPIGVAPVPLPAAGWLLAASLAGLGAARRLGRERPAFRNPSRAAG